MIVCLLVPNFGKPLQFTSLKIGDNYRIFGIITIDPEYIKGIADGALFAYDRFRYFDFSGTSEILEANTYLNPSVDEGTFTSSLSILVNETDSVYYKIEAVDIAGNVSKATYVLVKY